MNELDSEFFEAYKSLDRLCSDIYSCLNGVSEYIRDMESKASVGRYKISSWESDYKQLKHVRWVRNQIAHDSSISRISEPADLDFVRDFRKRILSGGDPITLLRKAVEARPRAVSRIPRPAEDMRPVSSPPPYSRPTPAPAPRPAPQKHENRSVGFNPVLFLFLIAALIVLIVLLNR